MSKVKIRLYIHTGYSNAKHEAFEYVDRDEWEAMSEEDREKYLDEAAQTFMSNHIDFGAYVVEARHGE